MGGEGPLDVRGKLESRNATALLAMRRECKKGALEVLHGDVHTGTYPTASQFSRALIGGTGKESLLTALIYSLMMPRLVVLTRIQI